MKTYATDRSLRHRDPQDTRFLDMFDGALPPEPPGPPARATHDFLVLCLRPGEPPESAPPDQFRSAA